MPIWSCGVTATTTRIASGHLERTIASLAKAGFPTPHLFIDGLPTALLGDTFKEMKITCHSPCIRLYGNFHLGLSEMFIREPFADYYAMFQDDLVCCMNLREYLESGIYPDMGYLNLYTFNLNLKKNKGWYPSNQLGKGAVGLVFSNDAAQALLRSHRWLNRPISNPANPKRLWKYIDGGIVESLKQQGYKEYVHNPSLIQHTGMSSTVGNSRHELASSFPGEGFNAMTLAANSPITSVKSEGRIGLVGYNVASGIGEVNRQLAKHTDIYRWLIKPHSKFPTLELPEDVDCLICPIGEKVEEFLRRVDIVLFAEVPYYNNLIELCKKYHKKTVCIPMLEWTPNEPTGWYKDVDLYICPTKQCYDELKSSLPCVYFPWPIDTERFPFKQRTVCNEFLFINGHGGTKGRKGGFVITEASRLYPEIPLLVRDQAKTSWGNNVKVLPTTKSNVELYEQGDVLISPHSVDGIGLEAMEAMACGMPVISTDGLPWNEILALDRIQSKIEKKTIRRTVDWYVPDPVHLVELCKEWLGKDITQNSLDARMWAENNAWEGRAKEFNDLVRSVNKPKPIVTAKPKKSTTPIRTPTRLAMIKGPLSAIPPYPGGSNARMDKFLFTETLEALHELGGTVIVELGAIRNIKPIAEHSDGWSTVQWSKNSSEVYTIDNDARAIETSKKLVPNVNYLCCDGFKFLKAFHKKIDLLYLDGPDANKGGQEFHLEALLVAPLADRCLVLMDDCDLWPGRWIGRGKGELAIPKALEMGFKILHDNDRQVLLERT